MNRIDGQETIEKLINHFAQFGLPKQIVSDNGVQFTSANFDEFVKRYGIQHIRSAPYHPATNREAERFVQTFKRALKAMVNNPRFLTQRVQIFLFGYRTAPHSTTGRPPAELLFNRNIRAPIDLVLPKTRRKPLQAQAAQQRAHDSASDERDFNEGDLVFARWYHGPSKWRAGEVIERTGPLSYDVQVGNELVHKHVDQLLNRRAYPPARAFNEEIAEENGGAIKESERNQKERPELQMQSVQPAISQASDPPPNEPAETLKPPEESTRSPFKQKNVDSAPNKQVLPPTRQLRAMAK